jgi:hypothetical protein
MKIDNIEVAVKTNGVDDAVLSLERLTAAINAASAALDAFGERHPDITIKVCGQLATVDFGSAPSAKQIISVVDQHDRFGMVG